ncbi:PaaI family thioesterase [Actibacterium sp. 188UL27-1]|uniref:PaaI family thioesterase n=1 Tax=Actibacterium sp. 188UL27-1 TaxID=2786961 RepID=UPI00195AD32F|nr:PaaI family thioesterase [Actibacterium sp. 188UL27-1]MBM7069642.1 PaaI family thioesterase [Actibacterium sp. 188UL27-1]
MKFEAENTDILEEPYEFQKLLGFRMVDWTAERVIIQLPMRGELTNRYGIPHGGVHAAMLDTVMGYAGCYTGDPDHIRQAMTLTLNVNYLSRPKGDVLIAEGRKVGGGKRSFFAEGTVRDETGERIATGSGAFRYRSDSVG